ncbi:MAG: STAS domain-containing protein [Nocardioidaceae bacterium]|nr:STAS domain-containing protein [Nocardioidaceae bacterium]
MRRSMTADRPQAEADVTEPTTGTRDATDHREPPFNVEVHGSTSGEPRVRVTGELDLSTAPRLRSVIFGPTLLAGSKVTLDLRAVSFMDSYALGTLVAARRYLVSRGGSLSAACTEGPVARVMRMTGMDAVINVTIEPRP